MFDVVIKKATIIDGSNSQPYTADIGIIGEDIVKIGPIDDIAVKTINAEGKIVTPGFIDIHCHSDAIVFHENKNPLRLRQGFTTEVIGNCGISAAPVNPETLTLLRKYCNPFFSNVPVPYEKWCSYGEFLDQVEKNKPMLNTVGLVGHGSLRIAVSGFEARPLTNEEMNKAQSILDCCMDEGAFGMSSGLIYPPGVFANTDEIRNLAQVVADHGGIYASHMRSESSELVDAVRETIDIAEATGVSVEISHHKAQGIQNKGKPEITLKMISEAYERGAEINCDVYPYNAASTQFSACLPPWALEGGVDALVQRCSDSETRAKIISAMNSPSPDYENFYCYAGTWDRILINECAVKEYEGKTVLQIAEEHNIDPNEMALDIIRNSKNNVMMIAFTQAEEDIVRIMKHPLSMICTDGFPGLGPYHPRYTAAFTRILEKYVNQDKILPLPLAIHKMTGMPAKKIGLKDRGFVKEGMKADLVVIDMNRIHDNADYTNYNAVSDGIEYVLINGNVAVDACEFNNICVGKVLRHKG